LATGYDCIGNEQQLILFNCRGIFVGRALFTVARASLPAHVIEVQQFIDNASKNIPNEVEDEDESQPQTTTLPPSTTNPFLQLFNEANGMAQNQENLQGSVNNNGTMIAEMMELMTQLQSQGALLDLDDDSSKPASRDAKSVSKCHIGQ
jgi:hypothetical protein